MRRAIDRARMLAREHMPFAVVLGFATGIRVLAAVPYWPALYYPDSGAYIRQANGSLFQNPAQPAGYPLVIRVLHFGGFGYGTLTSLQHLAGLVTGALVYVLVLRLTRSRVLATVGAGVVLLDGYAIAIEQYVLTDSFFALLMIAAATLALLQPRREGLMGGGLILAVACLVRPVALFCVPVWLGYALWRERSLLTTTLCALTVLVPILGYAAVNDAKTGHFALTDDTAWLMYARVGAIGTCNGLVLAKAQRVLCPRAGQVGKTAAFYIYAAESPAVRAFGLPSTVAAPRVDRLLWGYARNVIEQRPLSYARAVAEDFADFFLPGATATSESSVARRPLAFQSPYADQTVNFKPRWMGNAMRTYASVVHTIRPLLGLFVFIGIVSLALPRHSDRVGCATRPAIALLECLGLALLLGAAVSHFELRYVLPAVPLLTAAGMIGTSTLLQRRQWAQLDGRTR